MKIAHGMKTLHEAGTWYCIECAQWKTPVVEVQEDTRHHFLFCEDCLKKALALCAEAKQIRADKVKAEELKWKAEIAAKKTEKAEWELHLLKLELENLNIRQCNLKSRVEKFDREREPKG